MKNSLVEVTFVFDAETFEVRKKMQLTHVPRQGEWISGDFVTKEEIYRELNDFTSGITPEDYESFTKRFAMNDFMIATVTYDSDFTVEVYIDINGPKR